MILSREKILTGISIPFHRISTKFVEVFSLDARSLALFRILIGCVILIDLFQRVKYLEVHYTDIGLAPRNVLLEHFSSIDTFSFHLLSGRMWVQVCLFIVNAILAVFLILGRHTKIVTFLCWAFLLSLHNRNTLILQGGDVLFRMLLFWGIFLPLGARFSLDKYFSEKSKLYKYNFDELTDKVFSGASIALTMQVVILYFVAGSFKISDIWITSFTGVEFALHADHFATPFGVWLRENLNWALPYLARLTTYTEFSIPFILLCPFFFKYTRMIGVAIIIGLHLGFGSSLFVGLFWVLDIVAGIALIPSIFWTHLSELNLGQSLEDKSFLLLDSVSAKLQWFTAFLNSRFIKISRVIFINGFVLGCLAYICYWVSPFLPHTKHGFPGEYVWFGKTLGFDQRWQMFSPQPMTSDGWFVIVGNLKDGSPIDVLSGEEGEVSFEKPVKLSQTFITQRWRKYFRQLYASGDKPVMLNYGKSVCRYWNRNEKIEDKKLESFKIYYVHETTKPDFSKPDVVRKQRWTHFCYKVPKDFNKKPKPQPDAL